MKLPILSFKDKATPDYQPSIEFHSFIKTARDNNNYSPRIAVILKDHPGQVAYALVQEILNPLGHINLSVEMLQSIIKDNDLKMYLDVIMRNSIRINNTLQEFLHESHRLNI
jgi:signal transduction histidine kinase